MLQNIINILNEINLELNAHGVYFTFGYASNETNPNDFTYFSVHLSCRLDQLWKNNEGVLMEKSGSDPISILYYFGRYEQFETMFKNKKFDPIELKQLFVEQINKVITRNHIYLMHEQKQNV